MTTIQLCEAKVPRVRGREDPCFWPAKRIAGIQDVRSGEVTFMHVCGQHFNRLLRLGWFDAEAFDEPVGGNSQPSAFARNYGETA